MDSHEELPPTGVTGRERLPLLICEIYRAVRDLEALVPGKRFTPDGHMVGSIGEAWATYLYGLAPLPNSSETHDAVSPDGRRVQVKTTQRDAVATYPAQPDHLLVLKLLPSGQVDEVFNGPAVAVWPVLIPNGKMAGKNGQYSLRLSALRKLMTHVGPEQRLPRIEPQTRCVPTAATQNNELQLAPARAMERR